jgi:hypothetical protein
MNDDELIIKETQAAKDARQLFMMRYAYQGPTFDPVKESVKALQAVRAFNAWLIAEGERVEITEADALLAAKDFLTAILAYGPVPEQKVLAEADKARHPRDAILRAKAELKVYAVKDHNFNSQWQWYLPSAGLKPKTQDTD